MKLSEIYEQSDGILSHAERDFYLSFCSFADYETGFTWVKTVTVAERCGTSQSNASRMFQKLEKLNFISKVKGGFLCLVGFDKSYQESNFTCRQRKFEDKQNLPSAQVKLPPAQVDLPSAQVPLKRTTHLTTQLTKEEEKKKITKKKVDEIIYFPIPRPDVELEFWNGFLEMRAKEIKKPLTDIGYKRLIKQLARLPDFDLND
mgnify:CR=1 FL=1